MIGKPIFLTGRYIDIPVPTEFIEAVAALAPPEKKHARSSAKKREKQSGVIERARKYLSAVDPAISGQGGHKTTYRAACLLVVDFDLTMDEARPLLQEWNARCEPPWSDEELEHKLEDAYRSSGERGALIESSDRFPLREVTDFDGSLNAFESMEAVIQDAIILPSADDGPLIEPEDPLATLGFHEVVPAEKKTELTVRKQLKTVPMAWENPKIPDGRTDIANGKRLAQILDGKARYVTDWDSWIVWDGKRWKQDKLGVRELAKLVPGTIFADSMDGGVDVSGCNWAVSSAGRSRIEAMIDLARSEPGIRIEHNLLDQDEWLLNCQNGIVDLRTGTIGPHDPEKLITRVTNVEFNPDASSYDWDRFLEKILVKEDLISHVQRLIGYCITGSTREQILPIFWGGGSNGKSTLLDTLKAALGFEYSSAAPPSLIMEKKSDSHPTELANLFGKRMVTAIETKQGQRLNEPLVKQLTGGDSIMARRMKEDFWEFNPTHKIILCTNHEPNVGDDYSIWRRLVMIPFKVKFWNPDEGETGPDELRRDNGLKNRLMENLEGVLAWAVRGAVDWCHDGLGRTAEVKIATAAYRSRQDVFGRFVEKTCLIGPQYRCRFSQLYSIYESWARDCGESVLSEKKLGMWLQSQKNDKDEPIYVVDKEEKYRWYIGLTWKAEYDETPSFE
ncbi:MAG: hypothetical protein JSS49_05375 [Planctomycetes bacterium]|nr:hypothetical protein [Planctomycetota bacterium]